MTITNAHSALTRGHLKPLNADWLFAPGAAMARRMLMIDNGERKGNMATLSFPFSVCLSVSLTLSFSSYCIRWISREERKTVLSSFALSALRRTQAS